MDGRNGYPRSRGPPNGSSSHLGGSSQHSPAMASSAAASGSRTMSRAEKFEDEKRRIMESCFSKTEPGGGLQESYITHIRIREDAQYPQTPPPPDSNPSNKKDRVVVVAVRNTGRVRMHKGRENGNGTFSIGKTWALEDLSGIESFTNALPQSPEEYQRKDWGGDSGFICTVGKPYYWAAGSAKEKDFFIASLVKIYRKYTNGKVPDMIGFSQRELEPIVGPEYAQQQAQARSAAPAGRQAAFNPSASVSSVNMNGTRSLSPQAPPSASFQQRQPQQPTHAGPRSTPSQENLYGRRESPLQSRTPPQPGTAMFPPEPPQPPQPPQVPRQLHTQTSQEHTLRQPQNRDFGRPPTGTQPGPPPPATSHRHVTPQSSRSNITQEPSDSLESSSLDSRSPRRQGMYPDPASSVDTLGAARNEHVQRQSDRWVGNGMAGGTFQDRQVQPPQGSRAPVAAAVMPDPPFIPDSPPQRRRPPMTPSARESAESVAMPSALSSSRGRYVAPEQGQVSTDSLEALDRKIPGGFAPTPVQDPIEYDDEAPIPAPLQIRPSSAKGREPAATSVEAVPMPPPLIPVPEPPRHHEPEPLPDSAMSDLAQSATSPDFTPVEEEYRPGLGPMIKKKDGQNNKTDVANRFKKAANAYGAFKPRAGGAFDRMKKVDAPSDSQDGITGVFQAPKPVRTATDDSVRQVEDTKAEVKEAPAPAVQPPAIKTGDLPHVTVSSPMTPTPVTDSLPIDDPMGSPAPRSASPDAPLPKTKEEKEEAKKRRRRSQYQAKYLSSLGIETSLIDIRAFEFDAILSDFGWGGVGTGSVFQSKKLEVIEADLRRELGRVEAGSWLNTGAESKDERVDQVEKLLDKAIHEVEELEGLLTLYGVELSSLNDDIAFIEAQSQGLQVQTANQKLLQTELQNLIQTVDIRPRQLQALKDGQIGQPQGLAEIEGALMLLYKAMITIDPNIRSNGNAGALQSSRFGDDVADMRALQEKRERYIAESAMFLDRLKQYMEFDFGRVLMDSEDAVKRGNGSTRLEVGAHDIARKQLWKYSPLMLFAREVDMISWDSLMRMYQLRAKNVYQTEFKNNFEAWKRMTRKASGDEHELLWTSADRDNDTNIGQQARKMTVKRTMTLARTMRNASGEKGDKAQLGRLYPYEAFAGALEEMTPLIFAEQNFVVDFFHASSTTNLDFLDATMIAPPEARRGTNIMARKMVEPDRTLAGKIRGTMDEMMSFWPSELQIMVQWATQSWGNGDPLQGVGIMQAIDRTLISLEDTNQEYIIRTLQKLHSSLSQQFFRLLDEQIKKIEDTKVKIKKRKGVIEFMRVFPAFSAAVETMMGPTQDGQPNGSVQTERTETRNMIDDAYQKINRAMFDALNVIAKESPNLSTQGQQAVGALANSSADPEDKEALNYHILLIENMNHYLEEVDEHGDPVLREWRQRARGEFEDHLGLYVDSVVRRPLGKLMDFLDTTTPSLSLTPSIASAPSLTPSTSLTTGPRSPHARTTLRKLLTTHDAKDMRKGVEALRRRVEKHFAESDEEQISRALIGKVLGRCEDRYMKLTQRAEQIRRDVFEGEDSGNVPSLQWKEGDVRAAFKR